VSSWSSWRRKERRRRSRDPFLSLPELKSFYFDRIWLKAYPYFFANLRIKEFYDAYREYRVKGTFREITENAFRLYRTLDCIRRGLDRGLDPKDLGPEKCKEIRRYGVHDYTDFVYMDNGFEVLCSDGKFRTFSVDQIKSLKLLSYVVVVGDRLRYEKAIYIEYQPWLRVMVKPFVQGFVPPMVRVFYNPIIRVKSEMGLDNLGYQAQHENFIDPELIDFDRFLELNHRYAFDRDFLRNFISEEWVKWTGVDVPLTIKVTQVELAYDSRIPKMDIVSALHFLGARSKTIKYSLDSNKYTWTDAGLKYYLTVRKGFQVKTYTKAWRESGNSYDVLNRIEFTINVNQLLDYVSADYVLSDRTLLEVYRTLKISMLSEDAVQRIKELLRPFIRCESRCEDHYAFWFDLVVSGQIKGTSYYRHVAEVYKKHGMIKVKGRGRNSVYTINENFLDLAKEVRKKIVKLLGEFEELQLKTLKPSS